MGNWQEEKNTVLEAARQMLIRGLVVGTSGNISLRLPEKPQYLAITPSGKHYDLLTEDDIQIVDFNRKNIEGSLTPSMETMLHISIYQARTHVNAVIHTHSTYASAAAVAGLEIPPILDDQVALLGGEIKLAGHAFSGNREQANTVIEALGDRNGVLLANHGAIGIGSTMRDAFTACELLEKTCKIYLIALSAGRVNCLPSEAITAMRAIYEKSQTEIP